MPKPARRRSGPASPRGHENRGRTRASGTPSLQADTWADSRSGARAIRGFTYQHIVGAWLLAQLQAGLLDADELVPEGHEDLSLLGNTSLHVQVKSRIEGRGPFSPSEAAKAIVKAYDAHARRAEHNSRLLVVFERPISGQDMPREQGSTLRSIELSPAFVRALDAAHEEYPSMSYSVMLESVEIVGLSWEAVKQETLQLLALTTTGVPTAVLALIGREYSGLIQLSAANNADREIDDRASLTRTMAASTLDEILRLASPAALQEAINTGACEALSYEAPSPNQQGFYEGVSSQPGHVAAGLVVADDELLETVARGLGQFGAVVLHGPSGVGKSAALWSIPQAYPGVLWFRVRRLLVLDVVAIVKLVKAWVPSSERPVGLLVDSAGAGSFEGWAQLRHELLAVAGTFVVGTARNEDMVVLGDVSDTAIVSVTLTERLAAHIHKHLIAKRLTSELHWREAYENAHGLTMEYTHLLTRGKRLQSVLTEQIATRMVPHRHLELELLAICSVAGSFSTDVPLDALVEEVSEAPFAVRAAVERLHAEHFISKSAGSVVALHQLRSSAAAEAIHRTPPPTYSSSVARVLRVIDTTSVSRFVSRVLTVHPGLLSEVLCAAAAQAHDRMRLQAFLHGLRAASFTRVASAWASIAEQHGVYPSVRPIVYLLAIGDVEFPQANDAIQSALKEMRNIEDPKLAARLIESLDDDVILTFVRSAPVEQLPLLFSELRDASFLNLASVRDLPQDSQFIESLNSEDLVVISRVVASVRELDEELAAAIVDALGGEEAVLARVQKEMPWVLSVSAYRDVGGLVGKARLLHTGELDGHKQAVSMGRMLLRLLPSSYRVDVKVLLPGGHELTIGNYNPASTALVRKNDIPEWEIEWNRERAELARALSGASDTSRLATANAVFERLRQVVDAFCLAAVGRGFGATSAAEIEIELHEIGEAAHNIAPTISRNGRSGRSNAYADPLSTFITDLTDNVFPRVAKGEQLPALATHLLDTVLEKSLNDLQRQPWSIIGLSRYPVILDDIDDRLRHLHAVLYEVGQRPSNGPAILAAAKNTRREWALRAGAERAVRLTKEAHTAEEGHLRKRLSAFGAITGVMYRRKLYAPPTSVALCAVDSASAWPKVSASIVQAFSDEQGALGVGVVVIPIILGKRIDALALRMVGNRAWPYGELSHIEPILPPAHETPTADSYRRALDGITRLYAVRDLPSSQLELAEVDTYVETGRSMYEEERRKLAMLPVDGLTEQMIALLDALYRASSSLDGTNYAAALTEAVVGESEDPLVFRVVTIGLQLIDRDIAETAESSVSG